MAKMTPIPKKSLQMKLAEGTLNIYTTAENKGIFEANKAKARCEVAKTFNKEEKNSLMDFIFGKSDINPIDEKITKMELEKKEASKKEKEKDLVNA